MGFADIHGALCVSGGRLIDRHGAPVRLVGVSTHGIAWFPQYVCRETFTYLRDSCGVNCVRLALYTYEYMGYCTGGDMAYLTDLVIKGADLAQELGRYVIIDWHVLNEKDPLVFADDAAEFFETVSKRLAGRENVIYEICNEPNSGADWEHITAYANRIIPVIRGASAQTKFVQQSVILVGTPTWSQDLFCAAEKPLCFDNVMYTLHFYAATHGEGLRSSAEKCIKAGLPVFVSEYGLCDSSGGGCIDEQQAAAWLDLLDRYDVSRICWNLSNHDESAALIKHGCEKLSGWTDEELTPHGRYFFKRLCE